MMWTRKSDTGKSMLAARLPTILRFKQPEQGRKPRLHGTSSI
jgi:hypothetical protein